ncbi:MAG: cation:proton antiporter [Acidimicrobiaceae bacterium]|nr:cation:proton antiporter [Acidimicrobiaceae bacterium]
MHTGGDLLVIELGALVLALAVVARLARRIGLPALPLYLLAGLVLGEGSLFELDASEDFIEVGAEIGVILMLLMLGLEFSTHELINNVRRSTLAGAVDLVLNFTPGFVAGLILGFDPVVAVLLGGVTYISSSGIVAKLVADLDRIGNHETSVVLSVLVIEDLAMVLYLPIVSGVLFGGSALSTVITVAISLMAVLAVLGVAYLLGDRLSAIALSQSSEALLLTLLGGTLLVAGIAGRLGVSTAVGAFVVGVALSGDIVSHARGLLLPLRNLFAAVFFVFFGLKVDLGLIPGVAVAALAIAAVTVATKIATGWIAAGRAGIGRPGRLRAGAALIAHGEFSIVIAELGIGRESDLGALAATYVIILTLVGAVLYQFSDSITLPTRKRRRARPRTMR